MSGTVSDGMMNKCVLCNWSQCNCFSSPITWEDVAKVAELRTAIAHERDRARRVVRVFWRVRWDNFDAPVWMTYSLRNQAMAVGKRHKSGGGKVYRVTVRRKKKNG